MSVSIIVPAYNEEKRIRPFLSQLSRSLEQSFKFYEVVFVNDGSTDRTPEILAKFKGNNNDIKIISYRINRGKGFALREGIRNSQGDFIVSVDADNSFRLEDIIVVIDKLQSSDVVIGNKYMKNSKVDFRFLIGKCFNLLVNGVFHLNVYDCFSGLKGYRREIASVLFERLYYERWLYDVEVLVKAKNRKYTVSDIPIEVKKMKGSKFNIVDPLKLFFQILKMKYFDKAETW